MKKILFSLCFFSLSIVSHAQLEVGSTGNVTIGEDSTRTHTVNGFTTFNHGLKVNLPKTSDTQFGVRIIPSQYYYTSNTVSSLAAYTAKTNLTTLGVAGLYYPRSGHTQLAGIGIYGASSLTYNMSYSGAYAGYFNGDVRVTGTLYGTLLTPSTSTSSNDVIVQVFDANNRQTAEESVSERLLQVPLLQYYRSPDANKLTPAEVEQYKEILRDIQDGDDSDTYIPKEKPQTLLSQIKYGLDIDQMKKAFPELVYEDKDGNVSINYIEMIPVLVQAINELQAEINQLKEPASENKAKSLSYTTSINTVDETVLSISQNTPNPFSETTSIEVSVPTDIKTANIIIFDMSGKQVQKLDVKERGVSRVTVIGSGLAEGMYIYSLVADGKVVGTKKMILTK